MESSHENTDCLYLSSSPEYRESGKGDGRRAGSGPYPTAEAKPDTLATYDLIGFGSGIYFGKHHKTLLQFVEMLPPVTQKKAFVFSTCGDGKMHHAALKEKLANRGFAIVDEFCCKGWDTVGPLKLFGGINKGRPDENDLAAARAFAQGLKNKR